MKRILLDKDFKKDIYSKTRNKEIKCIEGEDKIYQKP